MIRKAVLQDIDKVEEGYIELLRHEKKYGAYTVWQEGVYPTRKTAEEWLSKNALYVTERDGEICASIAADRIQPNEYSEINWKYQAQSDEIMVIHLLCVRPSKSGCGIGREMVRFVLSEAKRMNCKTVRLDTGSQNKPAVSLYGSLGFELAGMSSMAVGGLISHKNHLFFEKAL